MKIRNRCLFIRKIVCFVLSFLLLMALAFGSVPGNAGERIVPETESRSAYTCGSAYVSTDHAFEILLNVSGNPMRNIVDWILESHTFLFSADLPVDQAVSSDGKYIDWNVILFCDYSFRERVSDMDLSAQAPISDTENVTMRHTTYIINKNMKRFYHPAGGIPDHKGDHALSDM